jgi:hypothetical protein
MHSLNWSSAEFQYEGLPLLIRKPDFDNIWQWQEMFPMRLSITHHLSKIKSNGLPENEYNWSLADFDAALCDLFEQEVEGIIFLIETFSGERHYYYYISETTDFECRIVRVKEHFGIEKIEVAYNEDVTWDFINKYPFGLFRKPGQTLSS